MANATSQLFHLLWSDEDLLQQALRGFLSRAQGRATRLEADRWLADLCGGPAQAQGLDLERVDWSRLTEFLCTCYYAWRARQQAPNAPGEDFWERDPGAGPPLLHPQRARAIFETVPIPMLPLEEKLLALGGHRLVYIGEPDLAALLARGQPFDGPARLIRGQPSRCHMNVADLWEAHRARLSIVTGYALSGDGLWRQHSFLLRTHPRPRQRRLIETTAHRIRYFGVVLDEQEAERFCLANCSGFPYGELVDI